MRRLNQIFLPVAIFLAMPFLIIAQEESYGPFAKKIRIKKAEEKKSEPVYEPSHVLPGNQFPEAINVPAAIKTKASNVFLKANFIYWQAFEQNLELAQVTGDDVSRSTLKLLPMKFDFHPGFQAALGIDLPYDAWDFTAEYTWYHAMNKARYATGLDPIAINKFDRSFAAFASEISARWRVNFDLADLTLGRKYYVSTNFLLHPYFSARYVMINQRYIEEASILGSVNSSTGALVPFVYFPKYNQKSRNWSLGPKIGLDIEWLFADNFKFFADGGFSVLYAHYKIQRKTLNMLRSGGLQPATTTIRFHHKFYDLRTNLDLAIGLGWGMYFNQDRNHVCMSLAYEFHQYWDQNLIISNNVSSLNFGSLNFNGVNLGLRFDF